MKTCQVSFNSFYCQIGKLHFSDGGGGSGSSIYIYWIKNFYWTFFIIFHFSRYQTIFKFNEWKLIIEKTASNKKSVARKSHVSITFYIFTNADSFLSSLPAFPPVKASSSELFSFPSFLKMFFHFNYFPFVCEIMNISKSLHFYWCRSFLPGWKKSKENSRFVLHEQAANAENRRGNASTTKSFKEFLFINYKHFNFC